MDDIVRRGSANFILAYQVADDARRETNDRFWGGVAEVLAYSVVWGVVVAAVAALLGSVLLWGVLLASAAH